MLTILAAAIMFAIGLAVRPDLEAWYLKATGKYVDKDSPAYKIAAVRGILPIPPEYLNPDGTIKYPPGA